MPVPSKTVSPLLAALEADLHPLLTSPFSMASRLILPALLSLPLLAAASRPVNTTRNQNDYSWSTGVKRHFVLEVTSTFAAPDGASLRSAGVINRADAPPSLAQAFFAPSFSSTALSPVLPSPSTRGMRSRSVCPSRCLDADGCSRPPPFCRPDLGLQPLGRAD